MIDLQQVIHLLKEALDEPSRLSEVIAALQKLVWKGQITDTPEEECLRDLSYDLDFFEADPIKRREDPSFLDESEALREIQETLSFLERPGNSIARSN